MMKNIFYLKFIGIVSIVFFSCSENKHTQTEENNYDYTKYGRLTDPKENEYMLKELPDDLKQMCDIANVQSVYHTMLSQWKIPRNQWKAAVAKHDVKDILYTLKIKGNGTLSIDRKLEDRIFGACTKEAIFSTAMFRAKGIPARVRVGYMTNLYAGEKAIEFWRNINNYGREVPFDSAMYDQHSFYMKEVNKSVEH